MEGAHLKRTVQAVEVLEAVVLRGFGPHGGQVLFTRDTGHSMLSRGGAQILTALRLQNPVASMVVECASEHGTRTGDGSKSFILLLASLVRMIERTARTDLQVSLSSSSTASSRAALHCASARRLADLLLSFSTQRLDDLLTVAVLPYTQRLMWRNLHTASPSPVQRLLSAFFYTRLSHDRCIFFSGLLCELLSNWTTKRDQPYSALQFLIDNWPALCSPTAGFPIDCSRLLEGQVIHRDFATPSAPAAPGAVKSVVLTKAPDLKFTEAGEVLKLGCEMSVLHFSSSAESSLDRVISQLQRLGVSVLLSSVKQPAAVLALTARAGISVVECISQEDFALFTHLSDATPVSDFWDIQSEHVVSLAFCKATLLGAHRYVHVGFPDRGDVKPCSVVVCGAAEGQSEQNASAMQAALRMLQSTWQPSSSAQPENALTIAHPHNASQGHVLTAGGTFEFLLSHALLQNSASGHANIVSKILADSLLCIPRHIYSHKPRRFAQMQAVVVKYIQEHRTSPSESCKHLKFDCFTQDSGLESILCKRQLLLAVLQCVTQLFRIDSVLHTRSRLKTITNISCEDEGDEANGMAGP